ncbi:MAG: transposase [Verrucomicrobiota bacterium]|nr:transposase [Verrucomicrobiota bacterium]
MNRKLEPRQILSGYFNRLSPKNRDKIVSATLGPMLDRLNEVIPFEKFRAQLETKLAYKNDGKGGQPPFDPVFMLKVCVVQYFYGLSDAETEFQIKDRSSFQRFLGLGPVDAVPDTRTDRCNPRLRASAQTTR